MKPNPLKLYWVRRRNRLRKRMPSEVLSAANQELSLSNFPESPICCRVGFSRGMHGWRGLIIPLLDRLFLVFFSFAVVTLIFAGADHNIQRNQPHQSRHTSRTVFDYPIRRRLAKCHD
ncbi:hypothetical protein DdX_05151 [Ditylenchus destructor]|uniref:Uncharacterized protein n=1 Tax=Ditylenchus destructor TaxID=166010 RepID=A0AAD4NE75_9BILA|nr:hypothetical protein DdX_05151 [Ditylenchus destructor]